MNRFKQQVVGRARTDRGRKVLGRRLLAVCGNGWVATGGVRICRSSVSRLFNPAYVEGWALYAERFATDIGMYKDDLFGDLGRLKAEMFRATRLVVDSGLHADGWTREQVIAYRVDTIGMNGSEAISEEEHYIGQLWILERCARSGRARAQVPSQGIPRGGA